MELTPGQKARVDILSHFYEDNPPPVVLQLNASTTQNNAPVFVKENLKMLYAGDLCELIIEVRISMLDEMKKVMEVK
ncbi:hypothetical protein [Niabella sp.]|uniref:hypothetical protein n=1 Tax=Niabella sp. TaxID=1962976 RepID=UPI00260644FB|nr:hypothetical protein [Niabella sp.]